MLKIRVIPCLDVKDGRVVKGVRFVDLADAGDPVEAARAYDAAGADELCFLDITASHENRDTIFDVVTGLGDAFAAREKPLNHVALAWTLAQPGITAAIVGASRPEQLRDTLAGASLTLDEEDLALCDQAWYDLPRQRDAEIARR